MDKYGASLDVCDYRGQTALHLAVLMQNQECATFIIESMQVKGVNIHVKDNALVSPLMNSVIASSEINFI